jgi:hypothetical protein
MKQPGPPMSIVCPNCGATSHDANAGARGRSGRLVHCAGRACSWHAAGSVVPPAAPVAAVEVIRPSIASAPHDWAVALRHAPDRDAAVERFGSRSPGGSRRGLWPEPDLSRMPLLRSPPLAPDIIDATAAMPLRARPKIKSPPHRRLDSARSDHVWPRFLPGLVALQLAAVAAILLGRAEVVRVLPETASLFRTIGLPVNLRGLAFAGVKTRTEIQDGVAVLIVEGRIESESDSAVMVPPLRFALHDAAGAELYAWTTLVDAATLGPGESLPFRAQMASPPPGGDDVLVRFVHPSDG